ncbi:hypothetical protein Q9L58_010395 [Maublancomyces gigas]|uniref:Uncharacterized protein n=1 Tax=Discina gigas TaxID=1032678 RepID=A0ABR3G499_9PEZI
MEAPIHHALVLAAAVSKQQIESMKPQVMQPVVGEEISIKGESNTQARIVGRARGNDKFLLHCFNKISSEREISGVQAAATLLGYPENYTCDRYSTVQLGSLG